MALANEKLAPPMSSAAMTAYKPNFPLLIRTFLSRPLPVQVCGGVVQLVRTLACHAGGREFESRRSRQFFKNLPIYVRRGGMIQNSSVYVQARANEKLALLLIDTGPEASTLKLNQR
jgi:hypothetical protein